MQTGQVVICPPCSSVAVALGGLTLWHIILISRGETSVERHINRKETRRLREKGKVLVYKTLVRCGESQKAWKTLLMLQMFSIKCNFSSVMQAFRNPYHHGRMNNWKLLFGVEKRRWVQSPLFTACKNVVNVVLCCCECEHQLWQLWWKQVQFDSTPNYNLHQY